MATEREISRVRNDPVEWRSIVKRLLELADHDGVDDRHLALIESLNAKNERIEISYRQAEWLLDARDDSDFVATHFDFSIKSMLKECYENRLGIDDYDDEKWIARTYSECPKRIRRKDARRLYRISLSLGVVDAS